MPSNRRPGSRPAPRTLLLAGLAGLLLSSAPHAVFARQDAPKPSSGSTDTGGSATKPAAKPGASAAANAQLVDANQPGTELVAGPQPPDGKWLTDETKRQYYVEKTPKVEGRYIRLGEKKIRTSWGVPLDVLREDDKFFYYKVYKVENLVRTGPVGPSPQDLKAVADSYKSATTDSHLLAFTSFGKGLPSRGQWRNGFDIADMNGDGHLDIIHGPARKSMSGPAIFLGDGKGNWRRWSEAKYAPFPYDYGDAKVADSNGDGHMDIALAVHLNGLTALVGDGKGNFTLWNKGLDFQQPGKGNDDSGFSSRAIAIVDWNHDGRPDILAIGEGPRLEGTRRTEGQPLSGSQAFGAVIYLNQGDGTWKRKDQGTGKGLIFGDGVAVGDFNADGRPDFATASSAMGRKDLVNIALPDGNWDPTEVELVRPGAYVRAVATGDFDHDGRADLAVGYISYEFGVWRSGLDLFLSRPDGKWERRVVVAQESRAGVTAVGVGDVNGDGKLDLVALTGEGETWVFLGDGKGGFTRDLPGIPQFEKGCRGYHVQLADLDGDGKDEIVTAFAGENSAMITAMVKPPACNSEGGLFAWHAESAAKAKP